MKTPVEVINAGALLLVPGEDTIVRGLRDVLFRFTDDEAAISTFDHDKGVVIADISPSSAKNGLTARMQYDRIEIRYTVRQAGPDMVSIVYTIVER